MQIGHPFARAELEGLEFARCEHLRPLGRGELGECDTHRGLLGGQPGSLLLELCQGLTMVGGHV